MSNIDNETKARIEAEENYRAQVRAEQTAKNQPQPKKQGGCGRWFLYLRTCT
ncbi:hypothetical protein [Deinococcus radiophilus]|uniref:hypothetical protein n=1 Tax=Deinococcus radiophilus TaxID=32062 RepID=UPI0036D3E596